MKVVAIFCFAALAAAVPMRVNPNVAYNHGATPFESAPYCIRESSATCLQSDWVMGDRAESSQTHTIFVGVARRNMDVLNALLDNVADPKSPAYGRWLSFDELRELTAYPEATEKVEAWLKMHGFETTTSPMGEYIDATGSVEAIEKLLNTQMFTFSSAAKSAKIVRSHFYSLPVEIAPFVEMVGDVVNFPQTLAPEPEFQRISPNANGQTDPALINSFYHINSNTVAHPNATQAVYEALGQSYAPADLAAFQQKFNIPSQKVYKVVGPNSPSACLNPNSCAEASLDIQYLIAVAQGTDTTFWSIGAGVQDIFYAWAKALLADSNPPLVHSISYGSLEQEEPSTNLQRFEADITTLTARGLTIVVASGDDGVANFQARNNPFACGFHPSFPATAPHSLAVGATQGPEVGQPEIVCSSATGGLITSGGGFSSLFNMPSYQSSTVQNFLQNGVNVPSQSLFNAAGRAYPDVAMIGHNYVVAIANSYYILSGTSCSTPVTAGLITLVNGMRLAAGKPPLGFVTPAIYQNGHIFNDITSGKNNCCAGQQGSQVCCDHGFTAGPGWEPICGFGTIDFAKFSSTFSSM